MRSGKGELGGFFFFFLFFFSFSFSFLFLTHQVKNNERPRAPFTEVMIP